MTLPDAQDEFHLCQRGRAYVLYEKHKQTLQLCDVATGGCRHVFAPRACPATVLTVLTVLTDCAPQRQSCTSLGLPL